MEPAIRFDEWFKSLGGDVTPSLDAGTFGLMQCSWNAAMNQAAKLALESGDKVGAVRILGFRAET